MVEQEVLKYLKRKFKFEIKKDDFFCDLFILAKVKKNKTSIVEEVLRETKPQSDGLSSNEIDLVYFFMILEQDFKVIISDKEFGKVKQVKHIIKILERKKQLQPKARKF